jgi:hypothetical protein
MDFSIRKIVQRFGPPAYFPLNDVSREDMLEHLLDEYDEKYVNRQILRKDNGKAPNKAFLSGVIKYLRIFYPDIYDFREAKEYYHVYELDNLQLAYLDVKLRGLYSARLKRCEKEYSEALLRERNDSGRLCNPYAEREKSRSNSFHTVRYYNAKRVGYRGKKNENAEKSAKAEPHTQD